jgi:hypothetical protein
MPSRNIEEGVSPQNGIQRIAGQKFAAEIREGVYGVVRGAVRAWLVDIRRLERRDGLVRLAAEEGDHGKAVGVRGDWTGGFERLTAGWSEEDAIQREG